MSDAIPIFSRVNAVLNKAFIKVKELAKEKVMTKEEI